MTAKAVLVTGAQQGIGAAAARALAAAGHDVAVNWLDDRAAAEAVAADVRAAGRRAVLVQGSVGTATECAAIVQAALDGLG
ncbi:MAG: SDR family NAD(P)-dependent oxidoreductase, partial [Acetobacteraceae bacterium]